MGLFDAVGKGVLHIGHGDGATIDHPRLVAKALGSGQRGADKQGMAGTNHLGLFNPTLGVDCVADGAFALDALVQCAPRVSRRLLGNRQVLTAGRRCGFGLARLLGSSSGGLLTLLRCKLFGGLALLRLLALLLLEAGLLLTVR